MKIKYRTFEDARKFIQSLKLKKRTEWRKFLKSGKRPSDIPSNPTRSYQEEWKGWGDFLGTGGKFSNINDKFIKTRKNKFRSFSEARKFSRNLLFSAVKEWRIYCISSKKPSEIPAQPDQFYEDEWINWYDWLGIKKKQFLSFSATRKYVHSLDLKSGKDWTKYSKSSEKPIDIPGSPDHVYKKEWKGWGDFLGTGTKAPGTIKWKSFEDARIFAHSLKLEYYRNWIDYCKSGKRPKDIPSSPDTVYKKEWKGVGDWLGTGNVRPEARPFKSFSDVKKYVQSLGIKSQTGWTKFKRENSFPKEIPRRPDHMYKKEWKGWGDFLGTGTKAPGTIKWKSFEDARQYVHGLKLKTSKEWEKYCRSNNKPKDIPNYPSGYYKSKWKGIGDWLGTGTVATYNIQYLSMDEAKSIIHNLKLQSRAEWSEYSKNNKLPNGIPKQPAAVYKKKGRMD